MLALIVAVVGALLYALAQGKAAEMGRLLFFIGMFWYVAHPWLGGR
jgi:hypothetical protein